MLVAIEFALRICYTGESDKGILLESATRVNLIGGILLIPLVEIERE